MQRFYDSATAYFTDGFHDLEATVEANDFRPVGAYCWPPETLSGEFERFVSDKNSKGARGFFVVRHDA